MPRVCVFDVNETLLDLGALDPHFERIFGDASTRQAWFGQFLALWVTEMVTGEYKDFGTIGGGALEMVATVALASFTNYMNDFMRTEVDLPVKEPTDGG